MTQAIEFCVLAFFYVVNAASYGLAYLMLSRLGGNIFVNSIILSFAEAFSMGITGVGMTKFKDTTISRWCSCCMALFNWVYYFYTGPDQPFYQYAALFFALVGQAGAYNCIFVILELRIPPKNLGAATNIIMLVFGPLSYAILPFI